MHYLPFPLGLHILQLWMKYIKNVYSDVNITLVWESNMSSKENAFEAKD